MLIPDIFILLQWWVTLLVVGLIFFPITRLFFRTFIDEGYIFSKILGIIILSYLAFLLGLTGIIPFSTPVLFIILILPLVWYVYAFFRGWIEIRRTGFIDFLKKKRMIIFFEEALFLLSLFILSYIRSHGPDIHGLEKFMDFGFINSINRSQFFPPIDMWFPPLSINYYYFGHLVTAALSKISFVATNYSYNLMLATIFAFCTVGSFSIAINLVCHLEKTIQISKRAFITGILAAGLVSFSGNLHSLYAFFAPYENEKPMPIWEMPFTPTTFPNSYWYPNATRYIYNTIHEFPMYSWTVADLHGHVLDIPFVLLTIAVLLSIFVKFYPLILSQRDNKLYFSNLLNRQLLLYMIFAGFLLAVMYMTNAWDGIIYMLLTGFIIFSLQLSRRFCINNKFIQSPFHLFPFLGKKGFLKLLDDNKLIDVIASSFFFSIAVGISYVIFALPFNIFFSPFVSGIGVLCSPAFLTDIQKIGPILFEVDHCQKSPLWQLLILHGFFIFFITSFIVYLWKTKDVKKTDVFVVLLILLSIILIVIPEFIYAKDIYPGHYRANTMFKLVFQAFIMLSISVAYILIRISSGLKYKLLNNKTKLFFIAFNILSIFLIAVVFTYPFHAINSYYGELKTYYGLDGTKYLQNLYSNDYEAIQWINRNITGQPVILEAQGDSYTDYARVSTNTGLPTVLGWTVHEWLWRGSYEIPAPRIEDVTTLYTTFDEQIAKNLIDLYGIEYVFVGDLERQKYPGLNEELFKKLGEIVYEKGETKIYRLKNND